MTGTTWAAVSARAGRNDLPRLLADAVFEDVTMTDPAQIAEGIAAAWVMCEWPAAQLDAETWAWLFDHVLETNEFLTDGGAINTKPDMPATITLYRGAAPSRAVGMSWTDDPAQALWFVHRFQRAYGETLYRAEVDPYYLIGRFHARDEHEWVVHPDWDGEPVEVPEAEWAALAPAAR